MNAFQAISASVASSSSAAPTSATVVTGVGYPGGSSWTTEAGGGAGGGVVSGAGSLKEMVGSPLTSTPPASTHSMFAPVVGSGSKSSSSSSSANVDRDQVFQWIQELTSPSTREHALIELSRKREVLPDLAPMLWHSFGTMAALLQEIVMIYPVINPPNLTAQQSNRVCNALALLQCVASHPETRTAFLNAHIPLFLYPFLHTVSKSRPFEYLRLTSLGVVGALVKTDEQDVINFLLTTEIIPLCLRIMESGSELSKTVATFILQKILLDETGLSYICQTFERFSHVSTVLSKMVQTLSKEPSSRLLKHVVRCYLRLSDNPRAREALRQCLPVQLKDSTFSSVLKEDGTTKKWLLQLLSSLGLELPSIVTTTANTSISSSSSSTTAASIAVVTAAENGRPSATTLHSSSPSSNLQQSQ